MGTLRELGEAGLIRLAQARAGHLPAGALGIGDDAALVPATGPYLACVDLLVEGVHFRRATSAAEDLGWKALAVNLSDIAAMGGTPGAVLVGLALPGALEADFARRFFAGLGALAEAHGAWLAGGDTTGSPGPIMIALTALGTPGPRTLTRDAARPGDLIFATGTPGRAAAGLALLEDATGALRRGLTQPGAARQGSEEAVALALAAQQRPRPQLAAGQALAALPVRLALLDDSDGSAQLLALASGVDVALDAEALAPDPVTAAIAAASGAQARDWMLQGGEDYHLVGACRPADWPAVAAALAGAGSPGRVLGEALAPAEPTGPRALLRHAQGPPDVLVGEAGYAHFAQASFPPRC